MRRAGSWILYYFTAFRLEIFSGRLGIGCEAFIHRRAGDLGGIDSMQVVSVWIVS